MWVVVYDSYLVGEGKVGETVCVHVREKVQDSHLNDKYMPFTAMFYTMSKCIINVYVVVVILVTKLIFVLFSPVGCPAVDPMKLSLWSGISLTCVCERRLFGLCFLSV